MDYEKAYKEALERAKNLHEDAIDMGENIRAKQCEIIFPELAESKDERIRKELIEHIKSNCATGFILFQKFSPDDILTWLEKQKPIEHFELKAGHWYICHRPFCCRADHLTVKEGEKFMCEKDGVAKGFIIKDPEKYFKECNAPAPYEDEQKPKWTEEDEEEFIIAIETLYEAGQHSSAMWLKSLKQRIVQ